jgi:DNA-binding beta-propeller fold protein YncE
MKKHIYALSFLLFTLLAAGQSLPMQKVATYSTGIFDDGGTEIVAFDRNSQQLYSTNVSENKLDIFDLSDVTRPLRIKQVDLSNYISNVHSVAVFRGLVAVVGSASSPLLPGKLLFYDKDGNYMSQLVTGSLPDMVTFSPGGNYLFVANEGEPSSDYATDPIGSVSIINVSGNISTISQSDVTVVDFIHLDTTAYDPLINIYGNNGLQLPSQDLEPEYITIAPNESKAYVVCQENNAMAIIDYATRTLDTVVGLGYKDHGISGNGLDASDSSVINITTYPGLYGMYQPDAITSFEVGGQTYIVTANEGEARDYTSYSEEARVGNLTLDAPNFPAANVVKSDTALGRLKVTTSLGDVNGDTFFDSLFCFGARSFSIWDDQAQLVWDSGDDFEQYLAANYSANFNSTNDDNTSLKSRSDDKGPEPNALCVGEVDGTLYAFIGLERMGGIMIYDISNPASPTFVQYELNRDFTVAANSPNAGDLGPEGMIFVSAADSPNAVAMLIVANEVSGTIAIYNLGQGIGIAELSEKDLHKVYPNPSTGVFNTSVEEDFTVYDATGKEIMKVESTRTINLEGEKDGIYIVKDSEGNTVRLLKK